MTTKMPTYFISHGGGPWPWVPPMREMFQKLEASFVEMVNALPEAPKSILFISGHWEEDIATIMSAANPSMVYDYRGFPPETYEVTYDAPGDPNVANRALDLLNEAGIEAKLDGGRGYDHGTFVPMAIMYPKADIPLFQISLLKSYDPVKHFDIGRALARLRDEGVLIVGSGLSYHNLSAMGSEGEVPSKMFDAWLSEALDLPAEARTAAILDWESAPYARESHKQEDHLVPLFVALGAAENDKVEQVYHEEGLFGSITASSYKFG